MLARVALASLLLGAACSTPATRIKKSPERFESYPETARSAIRSGKIELGFTEEMVRMALGAPDRIHRRLSGEGRESLVWIYTQTSFDTGTLVPNPSLAIAGSSAGTVRLERPEERLWVTFEEGKATSIETRQK
jgi:hypothetical protein